MFRKAVVDDAEEVVRVVNAAYRGEAGGNHWTTESHLLSGRRLTDEQARAMLSEGATVVLAIKGENSKVVGTIQITPQDESAFVGLFSVDPSLQQVRK